MRLAVIAAYFLLSSLAQASESSVAAYVCSGISNAAEHQQCLERAGVFSKEPVSKETPASLSFLFQFWPISWWVIYYGFGLIIGRYIFRDAKSRDWVFLGIRPVWWAGLAIFDPAVGLLAYWVAHYSKLAQNYSEATAPVATKA